MSATYAVLDFPGGGPAGFGRRLRFDAPIAVITARDAAQVRAALRAAERAALDGAHVVGFIGYEAAPGLDPALVTRAAEGPAPLVWFGVFDAPRSQPRPGAGEAATSPRTQDGWTPDATRTEYDAAVDAIRAAIAAGDVYQVNHTIRLRAPCAPACAPAIYDDVVTAGHGVHHAMIATPDWSIVSASPELFLDRTGDVLTTRPMKGTVRRGRWLAEDRAAAAALASSEKDRAENLMIVDLLRNDLGRIARFGTVQVPAMFDIETYPTVHQMTSTVTARLRAGLRLDDIFAATFPCGSVTGAPKIAAMRMIAALEHAARGPYCGAIGVLRPDGSFTFSVAIRTLLFDTTTSTATYGTGGGITWDSTAAAEYDELTAKAALLDERLPPFRLIETVRLQDGSYARLDRHLQRLGESAAYWQFNASTAANAAAALHAERDIAPHGTWRVRITAGAAGDIELARTPLDDEPIDTAPIDTAQFATAPRAAAPLDPTAAAPRPIALADTPVSRRDRLLQHKTTARAVYDAHRARNPDVFDVLLWNEEGEVTEFTTGNVVARIDGKLLTPGRDAGLLAGTLRAELICAGTVREARITTDEIRRASRLWFINSVRGWVPVVWKRAGSA